MAKTILMPKLGATMEEGKIVEWKKKEGDTVQKNELLAIIETDKIALEYEAPESGVLARIIVPLEGSAAVGQPICILAEPGEKLEAAASGSASEVSGKVQEKAQGPSSLPSPGGSPGGEDKSLKVVPLVRKLAADLGISLNEVKGTGPGGRITKEDLLNYDEQRKPFRGPAPSRPGKNPGFSRDGRRGTAGENGHPAHGDTRDHSQADDRQLSESPGDPVPGHRYNRNACPEGSPQGGSGESNGAKTYLHRPPD